jgi:hypothetical protein
MAATVASVAAVSGVAAYLNGRYHITQDLRGLKFKAQAARYYAGLGMLT